MDLNIWREMYSNICRCMSSNVCRYLHWNVYWRFVHKCWQTNIYINLCRRWNKISRGPLELDEYWRMSSNRKYNRYCRYAIRNEKKTFEESMWIFPIIYRYWACMKMALGLSFWLGTRFRSSTIISISWPRTSIGVIVNFPF